MKKKVKVRKRVKVKVKRKVKAKSIKKRAPRRITKGKTAKKKAPAKKKIAPKKPARQKALKEKIIGQITHYFPHVNAGVIKLKTALAIGDSVKIKGHTTDLTQKVASMQINRMPVTLAKAGDEIGLLVDSRVRAGDKVYKA